MHRVLTCFAAAWLCSCAAAPKPRVSAPALSMTAGPEALVEQARVHARAGDLVRAEQYLVLAMRGGHAALPLMPELLEVCLRASRFRAALLHAEPVLRDHPHAHGLRYLVATLHIALGQRTRAAAELRRLVRDAPGHTAGRRLLAQLTPAPALPPPTPTP